MDEQQDSPKKLSTILPPPPRQIKQPAESEPSPTGECPRAATVISIVLMVFAGYALVCVLQLLFGLRQYAEAKTQMPSWLWWMILVANLIYFAGNAVMGVGLLDMMRWARKATIFWLVYASVQDFFISNIMNNVIQNSGSEQGYHVTVFFGAYLVINGVMSYFLTRRTMIEEYDHAERNSAE